MVGRAAVRRDAMRLSQPAGDIPSTSATVTTPSRNASARVVSLASSGGVTPAKIASTLAA